MTLDSFFPFVLPEVLGCPDPTVRQAILLSAHDFCRESLVWTEIQDPVLLKDGVADYDLDAPSQSFALLVRDVWCTNRRLQPITMLALQSVMPDWQTAASNEPTYYNAMVDRGAIRVFPKPTGTTGQSLVMRAVYVPTLSATALPDFLGQRYMDVIASGAKARLMVMPSQAWSNPAMGGYYQQRFDDGLTKARIEEVHDRVPGTVTVQPRRFGF